MTGKRKFVFDLEIARNFFSAVYQDTITKNVYEFVHFGDWSSVDNKTLFNSEHIRHTSILEHKNFLQEHVAGLIGYNSIHFDAPLIDYFLNNCPGRTIDELYAYAQSRIESEYVGKTSFLHDHLDLLKLHHFDNKAKRTSLKWVGASMNMRSLMDLPFNHADGIERDDIDKIMTYNRHDVKITMRLYEESRHMLDIRKNVREKYHIRRTGTALQDPYNWSDSKLGEEIMLREYCKRTGQSRSQVSGKRTPRKRISLGSLVGEYVLYATDGMADAFSTTTLDMDNHPKFSYAERILGMNFHFGLGGVHGCNKGIYTSDSDNVIIDFDIASMYPSIAVQLGLYPEHLGEDFLDAYRDMITERLQAKRAGDYGVSDTLKLALNSVFGKSNSRFSWLYDPKFTYSITVNGQLLLMDLIDDVVGQGLSADPERSLENEVDLIQANTDGFTLICDRNAVDEIMGRTMRWENRTGLTLEHAFYKKIVMRDVNNYIALDEQNNIKYKGVFEIDKVVGKQTAYHKNPSMRIVPLVLAGHFLDGHDPRTLLEHWSASTFLSEFHQYRIAHSTFTNHGILDWAICKRATGSTKHWAYYADSSAAGAVEKRRQLPKTLRYVVSKNSSEEFYKELGSGLQQLEAHPQPGRAYRCRELTNVGFWQDNHRIDLDYYYSAIMRIIEDCRVQPTLF